ncbi:MAG TPA: tetratricopeptide repeat protein, partial [Novosphingobium sp.]|nr:tetratricopeptide repeat protein [Novosphingobium sp.]
MPSQTAPLSPAAPLEQARTRLEAHDFAGAASLARQALAAEPAQRDALYLLAVAQRYGCDAAGALATLATLVEHHPA